MKLKSQNKTDFQYDNQNRIVKISYDNGCSIYYTYDQLGNRLSKSRTILAPVAAGAIAGATPVCKGADSVAYSVPIIANAAWYIWSLPAGATIISGDSSRSVLVNFSMAAQNGSLSVYGKNEAGSGGVSPLFPITMTTVPGTAGAISGLSQVVTGQSGVVYSVTPVSGATGYLWSLPSGASIASGANTASITVSYSSGAVSGNITVTGTNGCGNGVPSPAFPVTVTSGVPVTQTIQNVTIPSGQIICYNATQTITVAGSGTAFTIQNGGSVTLIAGQNIRFLPGALALQGGYLLGRISPGGPWCNVIKGGEISIFEEPDASEAPAVVSTSKTGLKVYPNPTSGILNVAIQDANATSPVRITMYNLFGEAVYSNELTGKNMDEIRMDGMTPGIYLLHVAHATRSDVVKVIRN
ncbi:MAG: T9SS type A sorting domain-containing protein [Bacteroidetes bacterium]|nr:T9SS type A sorting domain-containing protein [Bacteroidota bacterium]